MAVQWTDEMVAHVRKMRAARANLGEVAARVGVDRDTLVRWMRKEGLDTGSFYRPRPTVRPPPTVQE